jgi:hypothetical protein
VAIEILQPVQLQSNRAEFQITCTAPSTGGAPPGGSSSSGGITASVTADPATYEGPCPAGITFTGTITDNVGNRDVTYRWIYFIDYGSFGTQSGDTDEEVIHFDQPGSQSINIGHNGGDIERYPVHRGWYTIEILQPVQLQSNRAEFQITCTAPDTAAPAAPTLQAEDTTTDEEGTGGEPTTTDEEGAEGGGDGGGTDNGGEPPATIEEPATEEEAATTPPANDEGG